MKSLYRFLMACMCISASSYAGNYTWTGATNNTWSTTTNWNPNGIPGSSDSITINSTSTNLVLTEKRTVRRITMNSDTLDLGGDTLEITGSAAFSGGRINNGVCYPQCTGLLNFNSTTFGAQVRAKGQIKLNGCTFNSTAYFEHVGSAAGTGTGGNTFNGTTTLRNAGTSLMRIGGSNNDVFNGDAYLISVSNSVQISFGAHTYFNGNVEFASTSIFGINVGGPGNGFTYLASGKTITAGSGGIVGSFVLRNFIQNGTTAQSLSCNGSLNMAGCVFNGNLTCSAQALLLSGNKFYGTSAFTKTGISSDFSAGGNHFYGNASFTNNATNTAAIRLASSNGDVFYGDAAFNTNTGQIQVAYIDTTDFKGHITTNNTAKITFGIAGGYSHLKGVNDQIISGTGEYSFSRLIVNKPTSILTIQKPLKIDTLLVLQSGVIKGDSVNKVTIGPSGAISGMSSHNYIDAAVLKIGNTAFTFPIGANGEYRPITMGAPSAITDRYEAQYYKQQQGLGSTLDTGLNYISTCNYFRFERLQGTSNVSFTTNWYFYSCDVFDIDSTKLAGYQNGVWKNLGLMGYTGSDSSGSLTSQSAISGYKYFALGHELFPNLSFSITYDSSINPVTVIFTNTSRGIPNDIEYDLDFGRGNSILNDSILFFGRSTIAVQYEKGGKYLPSLSIPQNGTIQEYSYILDLSINATFIFSETLDPLTPHPIGFNDVAVCYDTRIVSINISGLTSTCTLDILPGSNLNFVSNSVSANVTSGAGTATLNLSNQLVITPSPGPALNAVVTFAVALNNCNLTASTYTNPDEGFQLTCAQSNSGTVSTQPSNLNYDNNIQKLTIKNIKVPEFKFISNTNTNLNKEYSMGEIVVREYEIEVIEGIAPSFVYDLTLEDDVELLKMEVVARNPGGQDMLIFNGQNPTNVYPCPTCLQGGATVSFEFLNTGLYGTSILPTIPCVTSTVNLKVKVDLSTAISISGDPDNTFTNGLYSISSTSSSNKILLRETVRIIKVIGCNINNDASCKNDIYPGCQLACSSSTSKTYSASYNIKAIKLEPEFLITLKQKISGVYNDLKNDAFTSCYDPINPSLNAIDLSLNILNKSVPIGVPIGSGAAFISIIQFTVNEDLFEWDDIMVGNTIVPPSAISWSNSSGQRLLSIDLGQCGLNASTNDVLNDGLFDGINSDFPTSNRKYQFLRAGKSFNVTFKNFRFKDCSSASWPLKYEGHPDFYIIGIAYIYSQNVCQYLNGSIALSSYKFINLRNNFSGYATSTADPLDVGTMHANPLLKFTFTETSVNKNANPTRTPWTIELQAPPAIKDVLDCPNPKYVFHLEIPVILNTSGNLVYRIKEVRFKDKNNAQIGSVLNWPTIQSSGFYDFEVIGATSPVFNAEVILDISCDVGFGLNDFIGQYRAYCNDNCPNCNYVVYGASKVTLHRHCNGDCNGVYVSTYNFKIDRVSKGWQSEIDYIANPSVPNALTNSILKDRVYPCDIVKVTSSDGRTALQANQGVPTLDELYFGVMIDENQLNAANLNLFSGLASGYSSFFTITATNGNSSDPCNNLTVTVPINWADVLFTPSSPSSVKLGYHVISFKIDKYFSVQSSGCTTTVWDLLKSYDCTISFEAHLNIENLQLTSDFVELKAIFGQFYYLEGNSYRQSCDPYIQNLTYCISPLNDWRNSPSRIRTINLGNYDKSQKNIQS